MKYTYSIVVVFLAIAIAVTQCIKEIKDQKETSDREAKLDSTSEELKKKSDTLAQMQKTALAKSEDLAEKQAKAIALQLQLNKYVTGGGNKPMVFIRPQPMYVYPGHEKRPREHQENTKRNINRYKSFCQTMARFL
jgi:Na+-transporting methylmalonyl-CoA/oxaloacetate decarboxylase gamma subunit